METLTAPEPLIDEQGTEVADPIESGGVDPHSPSPEDLLRARLGEYLPELDRLMAAGAEHELQHLENRHTWGNRLNRALGPPNKRQPRGDATLKLAGQRYGISESEVSKMRWFAQLVPNCEDLQINLDQLKTESILSDAPTVRSWTQLKRLIPALKALAALKSGKTPKPAARRTRPVLNKVCKYLDNATSELAQVDSPPDGETRERLKAKLRVFSELMSSNCQITLLVD